ncbi:MAG: hypothetical protein ACRD50_14750 [Candidatus Acidiferrales bacterium]
MKRFTAVCILLLLLALMVAPIAIGVNKTLVNHGSVLSADGGLPPPPKPPWKDGGLPPPPKPPWAKA